LLHLFLYVIDFKSALHFGEAQDSVIKSAEVPNFGEAQAEPHTEFASRCEHHFFNFAVQLRTMDIGVILACFTGVLIRNRWPSRLTS
jgi:hypothetical protein